MPTAPTPITPYATPPNTLDTANFDERADAKVADDAAKVTEYNALASNVYSNAVEAAASATTAQGHRDTAQIYRDAAAASAAASAASAGASVWASGNYTTGARAWSPTNQRLYRRLSPGGASPTDPASDATNWAPVPIGLPIKVITGTSGTLAPNTRYVATNPSACAFALSAMTDGDVFEIDFANGRRNNSVDIGAMVIKGPNGATATGVITHNAGGLLRLYHDGTNIRSAA